MPGRRRSTAMAMRYRVRSSTTRSNQRARGLAGKSKLAFSILLLTISSHGLRSAACFAARRSRHTHFRFRSHVAQPPARHARASAPCRPNSGLSGRAAGQRVRGRVQAGLVPGALRLEGVAPFGSPVFILVADGQRGTLLLLRDRRVLRDAPPEEILERPHRHQARLRRPACVVERLREGGCRAAAARAYGQDWLAVDLASGGTIYLHRAGGAWRIVAGRYGGLEVDYPAFAGDRPSQVVIARHRSQSQAVAEPGRSERRSAARSARRAEDTRRCRR